ncbi:hypothetical protein C5167_047093 [Papaver somniferum]|uniref:Leucine-rich repeat-containing N-terminal plant-type domain-containing protein n=1 Tax=Papaver somniferum TaxID=3469 RepID=A0A4Y7LH64_PAPSO|nr:protein STRUBBELIG-RECEPTOR FAMILY 2-like [Papaver somniferum]RZC84307.1 hypothetical protein C5167_047093 [Papaver somniferum]
MALRYCFLLILSLIFINFSSFSVSYQPSYIQEVAVLQDVFKSLNQPQQLVGWSLGGGDPCLDAWTGISCSGSSITAIYLNGLNLTGSLGGYLFNLFNLKQLDVSNNQIAGEVPALLPPNATHIDLSVNNFTPNIWFLATPMPYLEYLNLSHNSISGPLDNVFSGFPNLKQMDLSYNQFSGDLPSSFGDLKNLNGLFLQRNQFTGSVAVLSQLPLHDLYIQMNEFSGVVPKELFNIPNLRLEANLLTDGKPLVVPGDRNNFTGSSPNTIDPRSSEKGTSSLFVGLIPAGVVAFLVVLGLCVWFYIKSRRSRGNAYRRSKWP